MNVIRLSDCDGYTESFSTEKDLTYEDIYRIRNIIVDVKFPNGKMRGDWQFYEIVEEIIELCNSKLGIKFDRIIADYEFEI